MVQALDSELNNDIPGRIARVVERTDALAATYGVTHLQHGKSLVAATCPQPPRASALPRPSRALHPYHV